MASNSSECLIGVGPPPTGRVTQLQERTGCVDRPEVKFQGDWGPLLSSPTHLGKATRGLTYGRSQTHTLRLKVRGVGEWMAEVDLF